jgi:predicted O-methyltransferase YrrM
LTYLFIREHQPETVVEIGSLHGWSTTWILRALRDNGHGRLCSYDLVDHARRAVPVELAGDRWSFVHGDVRRAAIPRPEEIDYVFIDAAHTARFARWYLAEVLSPLRAGTPVSVHDVLHGRRPVPFGEGAVVLGWLAARDMAYFTSSRAAAPETYRQLSELKERLSLAERVHAGTDNPMIFFRSCGASRQVV